MIPAVRQVALLHVQADRYSPAPRGVEQTPLRANTETIKERSGQTRKQAKDQQIKRANTFAVCRIRLQTGLPSNAKTMQREYKKMGKRSNEQRHNESNAQARLRYAEPDCKQVCPQTLKRCNANTCKH
jgi:hypothetical protein